jgi:hypothetical protein
VRRRAAALLAAGLAAALLVTAPAAAADPDDDDFASIQLTEDGWTWEVVIHDGNGENRRTPIDLPVIGRPALSPDGRRIVFTSWLTDETDGRWGLFIVDIDGSGLRRLTAPEGIDRDPAWSSDGRFIAFSRDTVGSTRPSNCCRIRIKEVDGSVNREVPGTLGGTNPTWSPDGTQLAYERPDGVQVTNLDGTQAFTLTGAGGFEPAWSLDGDEIAYLRPNLGAWEIAVRPSGGGPDRLRVRDFRRIESPQWDPDGETLYYVRYAGQGYDGRSETTVWMQRGTQDPTRLFLTDRSIVHLSHHAPTDPPPCDFDADGDPDLAIGIPGESFGNNDATGAVAVLYATPDGITAAGNQLWSQAQARVQGDAADGNEFGSAVACGDFDGDGDADLAIGVPGDTDTIGAVSVIEGSTSRLTGDGDQRWTQASGAVLGQPVPGNAFGAALAVGDIDNDGYADLAVGIPGDGNGAGAVDVMFGGSGGLSLSGAQRWDQDVDGIAGSRRSGNDFGETVALGDFDGDGFDDLAIGLPGTLREGGSVLVLRGSASGVTINDRQRWHQDSAGVLGTVSDGNRFGSSLAVGDFNRDGYQDLAIGIAGEANGAGAVTVLYGAADGLSAVGDDRWHQGVAGIGGTREPADAYGSAVATGDFDGDGFDDLAVGIPGDRNTAGAVGVLFGSANGLVASGDQWIHQNQAGVLGQVKRRNAFGATLFAADFDADGFVDLAIGAPGTWRKGAVHVMYGSETGVSAAGDQLWLQSSTGIRDDAERNDRFGGAL